VPEVLPTALGREDENSAVPAEAVRHLQASHDQRDLALLRELALECDDNDAAEAVRGLILLCSREEFEAFLNRHHQELCVGALPAVDELFYMPEWLGAKGIGQERNLLQF